MGETINVVTEAMWIKEKEVMKILRVGVRKEAVEQCLARRQSGEGL